MRQLVVNLFAIVFLLTALLACTGISVPEPRPPETVAVVSVTVDDQRDRAPTRMTPEEALTAIVGSIPPDRTLAFVGFENLNGGETKLSRMVFHKLEPVLLGICKKQNVKLVEREELKTILDEWVLDMSGFTGDDQGARELLGADIILKGKVSVEDSMVHIYLKAMSLDDGIVLSSAEAWHETSHYGGPSIAETASGVKVKPQADTRKNQSVSNDGQLKLWTEQESFSVGDELVVFFEVSEPMYVTLVDVTPDGDKTIIFPNPYMTNNYCRPGVTYRIPPPMAPFTMEVTGPVGIDRIIAMTSGQSEIDTSLVNTRGITFTKKIVNTSRSRASIAVNVNH